MSRTGPARRSAAAGAVPRTAVAALLTLVVGAAVACNSDPSTSDPSATTVEPAVSFENELREAEQMIAEASTIAGDPAPPVHANSDGANLAGAPDPSEQRRDISVTWTQSEPPPFAAIRDRWTGSFGFTVVREDELSVHLSKGDMRASINQGLAAADGRRNVWFGVSTGLHPAAEVPEP